jgi:hypothetical protein
MGQHISPKRCYLHTGPHDVTTQKINITRMFIFMSLSNDFKYRPIYIQRAPKCMRET